MALAQFAPKIIGHLAGDNAEKTAEQVVGIAQAVTGEPDPETALKKIQQNPELQLKFQSDTNRHIETMEQMHLEDRAGAREREKAIVSRTGKKDVNLYVLAWSVIAGFFALCFALMKWPLPTGQNQVVFMLFGSLATGFGTVLQYFFGSSKSSVDKTDIISASGLSLATNPATKPPPKKP